MFKQIRSLLSEPDMQLEGLSIEVDEMYCGGRRKSGKGRPMRGDKTKTPVIGMVERKGRVVARATTDVSASTIHGMLHKDVLPESTVFTDEYYSYNGIGARVKEHKHIKHSAGVYVIGTFTPTPSKDFGH